MSRRLASPVTIVSLIAVLCGALVGHAADPIPIGVSVAQTGPVALAGQEQVLRAQIAEEYFNKHGGVNGRPIKLVFQDGGSEILLGDLGTEEHFHKHGRVNGRPIKLVSQDGGSEILLGDLGTEEYFNKHGGVNGRPIKLVFQDGGSDEPTAINAFQNLINVAKVVGIMGPSLSQQACLLKY